MVIGLLGLPGDGRNDLLPAGPQAAVGRRAVILYQFMKFGQGVIGNEREHVVLNVVIHVQVEEPIEQVGEKGSRVEAMVEDVFGQAGVLSEPVKRHQPGAKEVGKANEKKRKPALQRNRGDENDEIDGEVNAGCLNDPGEFAFGDEFTIPFGELSAGMSDEIAKVFRVGAEGKKSLDHSSDIRWTGNGNFGIATQNDGVAVMTGVGPTPDRAFAKDHEGSDLIEGVVHPVGLEDRAVESLVPSGVGTPGVEGGVDQIGEDGPPRSPKGNGGGGSSEDEAEPKNGVANRGAIFSNEKFAHLLFGNGALIPIGFGQAGFDGSF